MKLFRIPLIGALSVLVSAAAAWAQLSTAQFERPHHRRKRRRAAGRHRHSEPKPKRDSLAPSPRTKTAGTYCRTFQPALPAGGDAPGVPDLLADRDRSGR